MANRTPSFIVVGLVLIMFLLGFFYMSCSSTTGELRQTLEEFEERIRALTLKNTENEKKIESINTNKRELEEEKSNIQRQMEKKDSEINDINTKLNERNTELQSLKSDKSVLETQLKESKDASAALSSKNSASDKLQQEYDEYKKTQEKELNDLKQQIDQYKELINQAKNNQDKAPIVSNQRFQPLDTIQNSSTPLANSSNNVVNNPVPVQTNNAQQPNQNQAAPPDAAGQGQNNPDAQRVQRSVNDPVAASDNNNKTQLDIGNAQNSVNVTAIPQVNEINLANEPTLLPPAPAVNQNNPEQLQVNKSDDQQNNQAAAVVKTV